MCLFTFTIWLKKAGGLLGHSTTPNWYDTITILLASNQGRLDDILIKMLFQGLVYSMWRERNSRKNGGVGATVDVLACANDRSIRNCISSLQYTANYKLEGL